MAQNNDYVLLERANVFVAPNLTTITGSTIDDKITYIEANASFTRLFQCESVEIGVDPSNQTRFGGKDCDTEETILTKPTISATFGYLEQLNFSAMSIITGETVETVAASPVSITGEVIQAGAVVVSKGTVYVIDNKNGDNTVVTSVVVDDNGTPLVLNTNYTLKVDSDGSVTGETGKSYITFLTDTSGVGTGVDVDYDYTPNSAVQSSISQTSQQLPNLIVKIQGCDTGTNNQVTYYLTRMTISGELRTVFLTASGDEVGEPTPATVEVTGNNGSLRLVTNTK